MRGMFRGPEEKQGWRRAGDIPPPSLHQVVGLLAPWLGDRAILGVELMDGGLMNRNCRVRVSNSPDVVLRLYDREGASAATEAAILRLLRDQIPVPEVLYCEPRSRDGLPPFLVLELIDGISLAHIKRSGDAEAIAGAAYDAGRLLARLQRHRFDRIGLLTSTLTVDPTRLPDPLTTTTLIEHVAQSPAFQRRVESALRDTLARTARDWDDHPRAPAMAPTLVHGDFNSRNILVRRERGRWCVSAILDWEFAFAGPAYVDMGNFLRYERDDRPRFEPAFSRGLREGGVRLEGDWRQAARMADLPALCELVARESTPDDVATEVLDLVTAALRLARRATCRGGRS